MNSDGRIVIVTPYLGYACRLASKCDYETKKVIKTIHSGERVYLILLRRSV